jgi:flagellar biosynthesis repressor protein FlbT
MGRRLLASLKVAQMKITLRRGDRIFVNGAVMRVDRKVCVELLNDTSFLLESHFMEPHDATTPLKKLYFIIQTMILSPSGENARKLQNALATLVDANDDPRILRGLDAVVDNVECERMLDALKAVRALFLIEDELTRKNASLAREVA